MLKLLSFIIPLAASTHLTGISYGHIEPVQTLVPWTSSGSTLSDNGTQLADGPGADPEGLFHNMTNMEILRELVRREEDLEILPSSSGDREQMNAYLNDEEIADDSQAMCNITESTPGFSHLSRRSTILEAKDISNYKNRMQVDCREGPEICNQVCWFQNCVAGDEGGIQYPEYAIGYDAKSGSVRALDEAAKNRLKSGVTTSRGPPCMNWPMGQKFWDSYAFPTPQKSTGRKKKGVQDSTQFLG